MVRTMIDESEHYGGCTKYGTSDTTITLHNEHARLIVVSANASSSTLILPDARTLQLGHTYYVNVLLNTLKFSTKLGGQDWNVNVDVTEAGSTRILRLYGNSDADGLWSWENTPTNPLITNNAFIPTAATITIPSGHIDLICGAASIGGESGVWKRASWSGSKTINLTTHSEAAAGDIWYDGTAGDVTWTNGTCPTPSGDVRDGKLRAYLKRINTTTLRLRLTLKLTEIGSGSNLFEDVIFESDINTVHSITTPVNSTNNITPSTHTIGNALTSGVEAYWSDAEHVIFYNEVETLVFGRSGTISIDSVTMHATQVRMATCWQFRKYVGGVPQSTYKYTTQSMMYINTKYVTLEGESGRWLVSSESGIDGAPEILLNSVTGIFETAT